MQVDIIVQEQRFFQLKTEITLLDWSEGEKMEGLSPMFPQPLDDTKPFQLI